MHRLHENFEDFINTADGIEFWYARDLQNLLGYTDWKNFKRVLSKAKEACINAHQDVADHFSDVGKMVTLGSGSEREIPDTMLTRYACYLIAQNGDPRKEEIAFAQSYFAVQTRKQERIEEHIELIERMRARERLKESETNLSRNIYERGVDGEGFARIRSKGDKALFGGNTTKQMKERLGVANSRPLADFLPTVTITAKNLATEITNYNVEKDNLCGENRITGEHVVNNRDVRDLLLKRGIRPESLPPEEDLKKLERRVKKEEIQIADDAGRLSNNRDCTLQEGEDEHR